MNAKKILWISRHYLTEEQLNGLEVIFGKFEIIHFSETVEDIAQLSDYVKDADVIAAVLPVKLLSELVNMADGKPVIQSISGRYKTENKVDQGNGVLVYDYKFKHMYWQRISAIKLETFDYYA